MYIILGGIPDHMTIGVAGKKCGVLSRTVSFRVADMGASLYFPTPLRFSSFPKTTPRLSAANDSPPIRPPYRYAG